MEFRTNKLELDTLDRAISLWGIPAQVGMVMEECGELLSVLNRYDRGRAEADQVAEEIADVLILMKQMTVVFGENRVQEAIDKKMARLIERVSAGYQLRPAQEV